MGCACLLARLALLLRSLGSNKIPLPGFAQIRERGGIESVTSEDASSTKNSHSGQNGKLIDVVSVLGLVVFKEIVKL